MTIPTFGAVTMAQICSEFGAPSNTPLHSFVRGGSYVPNATQNAGVPTSTPITIDDLRGSSDYTPMQGSMNDLSGGGLSSAWVVLGTATCNVSGGQGTKSYAFSITGGDARHFRIDWTSGNQAQVSAKGGIVRTYNSQLKCTVTDDVTSIDVTSDLTYTRL